MPLPDAQALNRIAKRTIKGYIIIYVSGLQLFWPMESLLIYQMHMAVHLITSDSG